MFAKLLNGLLAPEPAPLPDADAKLALTALLVRLARTDGDYASAEIAHIDRITAARYGLSPTQAEALRKDAEQMESEAPDTVRFTRAIKDAVPYEDRISVVEALWQVALADGARDDDENAMLRMVAPMLGIEDQESARARQRVQAALKT